MSKGGRAWDGLLWGVMAGAALLPVDEVALWLRVVAVLLLGFAVVVARRWPVVAAAVAAGLGLAATPELLVGNFVVAQVVLAFLLGRRSVEWRDPVLLVTGVCAVGLVLMLVRPGHTTGDGLTLVIGALVVLVLPWLAGGYARQQAELVGTGFALAERLEREQDLVGERIRLHERSRISGDMHDSLGHELSMIALRAAALQVGPGLDEPARKALGELRLSAATATERLREIIGVLRQDAEAAPVLPPGDTVAALVERSAAAGMAITLSGELEPLPPMADRAVYRVVQEALTNAAKHAQGAQVTVHLETDAATEEAVVTVANAAPPGGQEGRFVPVGGHGLIGLDERVRLAGGRFEAREVDGGFRVSARMPVAAGAAPVPASQPAAQRELALARRKARRGMLQATWIPAALTAVPLLAIIAYDVHTASRPVLDADVYTRLRLGESRPSVEQRLPAALEAEDGRPPEGVPANPAGVDECRFYRTRAYLLTTVYRLCFTGGRLSHKKEVERAK